MRDELVTRNHSQKGYQIQNARTTCFQTHLKKMNVMHLVSLLKNSKGEEERDLENCF